MLSSFRDKLRSVAEVIVFVLLLSRYVLCRTFFSLLETSSIARKITKINATFKGDAVYLFMFFPAIFPISSHRKALSPKSLHVYVRHWNFLLFSDN